MTSSLKIENSFLLIAYQDFEEKSAEIKRYIEFLNTIDESNSNHITYSSSVRGSISTPISREVKKTIRASSYLLIYNMLESSICNAIDAIHQTLEDEKIDLQNVSPKLKKVIFNNLKNGLGEKEIGLLLSTNTDLRETIMLHGYNKKNLLSGNLDVDTCKKLEIKYGFQSFPVGGRDGRYNPNIIKEIKRKRNDLAHGAISFEECGQGIPINAMEQKYKDAHNFIMSIFNGLNNFLLEEKYLNN